MSQPSPAWAGPLAGPSMGLQTELEPLGLALEDLCSIFLNTVLGPRLLSPLWPWCILTLSPGLGCS